MKQEIIRLGSNCNQKCLFCNQEENIKKKNKKEIMYDLLSFKQKGVDRLVISGGEPTLFKNELCFTVSTGKKLGFKDIELQSNAVLLSDLNYTNALYELGLDSCMISLHYFDDEVSDYLTGAKGTYKKTIIGINNLIKIGVDTVINIVINNKNYENILDYIKYIHKNIKGFSGVSLSIVVPGKLTKKNNLLPKYEEISKYLVSAYDYCIDNNIDFQNPGCGIPICFVKDYYKYSLEYENYKSGKMYDELLLKKNKSNKIKTEICKKCIFNNYCLGIWKGYVELYGFEIVKPIIRI